MSSTRKFTLHQYSVMAASALLANNLDAQIIYTDIDPDIAITFDYQFEGIDMDNNGNFDFGLQKRSHSIYDTWNSTSRFIVSFTCSPYVKDNVIMGFFVTPGTGIDGGCYPYQLDYGSLINSYLSAQSCVDHLLGNGWFDIDGDGDFFYGPNAGLWEHKVDSAYLGVRFYGEDDCLHYGWIRLSVTDTLGALIIHDYGYEERCGVGLYAGDTTMLVPVQELSPDLAQITASGHQITVTFDNYYNGEALVYDMSGKLVASVTLQDHTTNIHMLYSGIFVVKLKIDSGILVKKLAIL